MSDQTEESPAAVRRRQGRERLQALAAEAKPELVTDAQQRKMFEEWEKAGGYIQKARQMLADSIVHQEQCAMKIVRALGVGQFRYKEQLLMTAVKGNTVCLRSLEKKSP